MEFVNNLGFAHLDSTRIVTDNGGCPTQYWVYLNHGLVHVGVLLRVFRPFQFPSKNLLHSKVTSEHLTLLKSCPWTLLRG